MERRLKIFFVFVYVGLMSPAFADPTEPCSILYEHLGYQNLVPQQTLEIVPTTPTRNGNPALGINSYADLNLNITPENLQQTAQTLAMGNPVEPIAQRLQAELGNSEQTLVSLNQFLPNRLRERMGTCNGVGNCYGTAMNFFYPTAFEPKDFEKAKFPLIKAGTFRFGDVSLIIRRDLGWKADYRSHAMVYIGGDFVLHKYGRASSYKYEYTPFESVHNYYQLLVQHEPAGSGSLGPFKKYEFRRYEKDWAEKEKAAKKTQSDAQRRARDKKRKEQKKKRKNKRKNR